MGNQITLGIPKGSLQESTLALFARAGLSFYGSDRSLWLVSNDPEVKPVLLRPQEIPLYVAKGDLDCGLAGRDWIEETGSNGHLRELANLHYSKRSFRPVRWVLAVPDDSPWRTVEDLKRSTHRPLRVSTELRNITEDWLAKRGIIAQVDFSWGATEAKAPVFADAIVEATETGASLEANRLRILDTVFESTTRFFANNELYKGDSWKRTKLESIALLLKSCMAADARVSIHVQSHCADAEILTALIPSRATFSLWRGQGDEVMIEVIAEKGSVRELIPVLARNGACRISVSPIEMLYE